MIWNPLHCVVNIFVNVSSNIFLHTFYCSFKIFSSPSHRFFTVWWACRNISKFVYLSHKFKSCKQDMWATVWYFSPNSTMFDLKSTSLCDEYFSKYLSYTVLRNIHSSIVHFNDSHRLSAEFCVIFFTVWWIFKKLEWFWLFIWNILIASQ